MGNFLHFAVGAITLLKLLPGSTNQIAFVLGVAVYSAFAAWFALVLFTGPHVQPPTPRASNPGPARNPQAPV